MKRVVIIGCGGAGKSTLARKLGEITGLPVVHLDQIFWSPGNWNHLEKGEFDARLQREMEKDEWILDGNYNRTMPQRLTKSDTVIYLDFNRFTCIRGWIGRVIRNWGKARPDMAPGCREWLDPEFFCWIWNYNRNNREKIMKMLENLDGQTVYVLKNRCQVKQFLRKLSNP